MFYSNYNRPRPACDWLAAKYTIRVHLPSIEAEDSGVVPDAHTLSTILEDPEIEQSVDPHSAIDPTAPSMVPRVSEFDTAEEPAVGVELAALNSP